MIVTTGRMIARMTRHTSSNGVIERVSTPCLRGTSNLLIDKAWVSPLLFMLVAIAIRLPLFGLPAFQSDEQFYLLVGQRMAEGALPFVDIWDRKPIGLFLIYRAVFLQPLDPVITYQVLGMAFSVATALMIERIARMIAPADGARLAGLAYLLYQAVFNAALGQSPVFYNLPVALAALLTMQCCTSPRDPALAKRGVVIMLLLGAAIQIKYTALFEGVAMGLLLLARAHDDGWRTVRLLGTALVWIGCALAPTLLAYAAYALMSHGEAFVQANFLSIFEREAERAPAFVRLGKEALALLPFGFAMLHTPRAMPSRRGGAPAAIGPIRAWVLAALLGFLLMGTWYDHYVGPLLVPFSVLAAPALSSLSAHRRRYRNVLLGLGLIGAVLVPAFQIREKGTAAEFANASTLIAHELAPRSCLYVYDGDSALYRTTHACIPTRFAYPSHLNAANEAQALGVDAAAEVNRIMASTPGVVVLREDARPNAVNTQTRSVLLRQLDGRYERFADFTLGTRRFAAFRPLGARGSSHP